MDLSGHVATFPGMFTLVHNNHFAFETQLFWIPKELICDLHKFGFWSCFGFHKLPPTPQCNNLQTFFPSKHLKGKMFLFLTTNHYFINNAFNGNFDLSFLHSFGSIVLNTSKQNLVGAITSKKRLYLRVR